MENVSPDKLIEDLGGCGRYQIRLSVIVHIIKTCVCWSISTVVLSAKTPGWSCMDDVTTSFVSSNASNESTPMFKSCLNANNTKCENIEFDGSMSTFVSKFHLVCDKAFLPSLTMSINTIGMSIGNPISGQLADLFGRKLPFFMSLVMLVVFNIVAIFSNSLVMFAVARFFIGMGGAFFLTVQYCLMSEFILASWRSWVVGFPSWSIQSSIFAFVAWLLNDWKYFHLTVAVISTISLASWWTIPESFRWLLAHGRTDDAEKIINDIADVNNRPYPEMTLFMNMGGATQQNEKDKKFTFVHLFKSRYLVKVTLLSTVNWLTLGFVAYGLKYAIQALSGNLYLNMFLFNVTTIPSQSIVTFLQNIFGRRKASMLSYFITGSGALVVGIVQYIDTDNRGMLTNVFAIIANMGIAAAWGSVQTMTIEMYPTVIRNLGFGTLSVVGRIGAIISPPIVYLSIMVPGLMYFLSAALAGLCICGLFFLPETKDSNLSDKITKA